jgi:hypothetical protein
MPELRGLGRQARFDVAQALSVCQLGERHGPVLLGAWKRLHRMVAMVTRDNPRERAPGQAIHQLREQRLSGVHGRASPEKGPGYRHQLQIDTTQNRRETLMRQALLRSSFGKLRTVVMKDMLEERPLRAHVGRSGEANHRNYSPGVTAPRRKP